ncbi:MAG: hypothetical protein BRC35_09015 [Cyanobacteria bacterium QH_10_48_56]|nr:MAG: hypothetical protein BRC35_09015 [Cyanobacteria bacterium QH_10_48_56]
MDQTSTHTVKLLELFINDNPSAAELKRALVAVSPAGESLEPRDSFADQPKLHSPGGPDVQSSAELMKNGRRQVSNPNYSLAPNLGACQKSNY